VVDFEAGLWQAIRQSFPGYSIQGGAFHWAQAVFRKIQEHGLHVYFFLQYKNKYVTLCIIEKKEKKKNHVLKCINYYILPDQIRKST
jgi:hypothetical protein